MKARKLLEEISEAAWRCADPGVQYDTEINKWHTCPNSGRISGCNPCSEYMHVDDSACNLASLNFAKFRKSDGTFKVESFEEAVDIVLLAQEIVVSSSSYPTEQITAKARGFRQFGMGYAGRSLPEALPGKGATYLCNRTVPTYLMTRGTGPQRAKFRPPSPLCSEWLPPTLPGTPVSRNRTTRQEAKWLHIALCASKLSTRIVTSLTLAPAVTPGVQRIAGRSRRCGAPLTTAIGSTP